MSDFIDFVQLELPVRPWIQDIESTGSLLVKADNAYSREYETLAQGNAEQVLTSQGSDQPPIFADVSAADLITVTNNVVSSIVKGQAVCISGSDTIILAQATAILISKVLGLVADDTIISSEEGEVQISGILGATTAQWDAVTGDVGGLIAGSIYYLSAATPGFLTATPPTVISQLVVSVGQAVSSTRLKIASRAPILL